MARGANGGQTLHCWKSRVYLTPEGEVALTPENVFILTPKEPWPVGSFLFRLTCLL